MSEDVQIAARDGYRLAGTLFRPSRSNGCAVLINSAAGVKRGFYAKFAVYLTSHGFAALAYDYRGIGGSRPQSLRGFTATMLDWIGPDSLGALDALDRACPGARRFAIGHSIGGHAIGFGLSGSNLDGAITVGSQNAYWKHWSGARRAGVWFMVHAGLPVLARAWGYFPARLLRQGEDLPMQATVQWARWCRHPQYIPGALGAAGNYARLRAPLRAYAIEDDGFAPPGSVEAYGRFFPNAKVEVKRVPPLAAGAARIGHFGFFREQFRDTLWRDAADWLLAHSSQAPG